MKDNILIAYNDHYLINLPKDHKFPIFKYKLIPETLLEEGLISPVNIFSPLIEEADIVKLTHSSEYVDKILNNKLSEREIRRIGFPRSKHLMEREFIISRGTREASLSALNNGLAFNVAGGTHHAYADRGEGFCLFNDVAIAANYLLGSNLASKILIIDLDVHQGNGTAKIFENEERVFTFSMHGKDNFPLHKEKSDYDIALNYGVGDEEYLRILHAELPSLIKRVAPDFLFYIAGADVLESDRWGHLSMTINGAMERDCYVFKEAKRFSLPIVVTMGGGYSPEIGKIVEAHCNTFRSAFSIF